MAIMSATIAIVDQHKDDFDCLFDFYANWNMNFYNYISFFPFVFFCFFLSYYYKITKEIIYWFDSIEKYENQS